MNEIERIDLDVANARMWFAYDQEKITGGVEALEMQHIISNSTADWMRNMINQLEVHFKALEIEYYKMRDIAAKDNK